MGASVEPAHLGYPALFVLVAAESAGVPVPGETALVAAAILAAMGHLELGLVAAFAALGAVVGDNLGYLIGRLGGRRLLERPGPFEQHRRDILHKGEPFFTEHGPKAVFLGRWVAGLRIAAAWLAGVTHMRWRTFAFWNALGGVVWATSVGLLAYALGDVVERIFKDVGIAAITVVAVGLAGWWAQRRLRRRDPQADPGAHGGEQRGDARDFAQQTARRSS
jgi:membrane protein DedA with SNARE-associated domain